MLKTLGVSACAFMAPASPLGVALVLGLRLLSRPPPSDQLPLPTARLLVHCIVMQSVA